MIEQSPQKLQQAVQMSHRRMRNFRDARMLFIRSYVGQYYDAPKGQMAREPLNLIFNAIRVLVPHLVTNFPTTEVATQYIAYRDYAFMLGKALDYNDRQLDITTTYRRWIVDGLFTLGILKTGLADSGTVVSLADDMAIDPGEVFSDNVSFDNFVFDPSVRGDIRESTFMGDRIVLPRHKLLESGLYNNALIERLPGVGSDRRTSDLSKRRVPEHAGYLNDEVEVAELWLPESHRIITVPGSEQVIFGEFLREVDYEGPDDGPYTLLSFTPPVPDNPLPVSLVGIWHDIHIMANRMAAKLMEQADRQKDVTVYRPAAADDAAEIRDADDGDIVATDDPEGVRVVSYGGQAQSNEAHIFMLQQWFSQMAGNPQALGGEAMQADSATEATYLAQNADVGLHDSKSLIYKAAAAERRKRAFYMHTNPLINLPLIRKQTEPDGRQIEMQLFLTPEARRGDFLDYAFTIMPGSMDRLDSDTRLAKALDFGNRLLPTAVNAAVQAASIGQPFNVSAYLTRMAQMSGIEWFDEVWDDPAFRARMDFMMAQGPQMKNSQGQPMPGPTPDLGVLQNGQAANAGAPPMSADSQFRADAQAGAAQPQREMRGVFSPTGG